MAEAYVIDVSALPEHRAGVEFELSTEVLDLATAYGIDLEVVYPSGISIDVKDIQRKLYAAGIVSLQDLKQKPSALREIMISIAAGLSTTMYIDIKHVMEDYQ